eukprot:CAMPEP_0115636064 /NCGR_PEP_ID=MMETSP0272-20121206/33465_1 /TAXON_ID=71861 /ORGANISM="Scrippsiella trochoidea, Strain CCMP3099" /LENGTH=198 /DNA_ID=CAMNT_0003073035 /DNA_START=198 /DNA_END=795 /DNA_ORIENTATION=-
MIDACTVEFGLPVRVVGLPWEQAAAQRHHAVALFAEADRARKPLHGGAVHRGQAVGAVSTHREGHLLRSELSQALKGRVGRVQTLISMENLARSIRITTVELVRQPMECLTQAGLLQDSSKTCDALLPYQGAEIETKWDDASKEHAFWRRASAKIKFPMLWAKNTVFRITVSLLPSPNAASHTACCNSTLSQARVNVS